MKRGLSNQRKPPSRPSIARVAATAVSSEITVPISSISAKPFTDGDRDQEEHQRGDRGDDVRVEDRVEALAVAGRDRRAHGLPGAHLFLDAFEDDDVRVGRDADREDQAGEARQRQRDVEEEDRRVVEERVDREAEHRDEAEEAVEHEQEERDDHEADDRRVPRLRQRAPCRAWPRRRCARSARSCTGSAPVWSTSARSCASLKDEPPIVDLGAAGDAVRRFESGSRCTASTSSSPSSTIAKCCDVVVRLAGRAARERVPLLPRSYSCLRDLLELRFEPWLVNWSITIGLAGLAEVGARPREHEVGAGHLRDRVLLPRSGST